MSKRKRKDSKHQEEIERAHVRLDSLREDHHSLRIWQSDRDKKIAAQDERIGETEKIQEKFAEHMGLIMGLIILLSREIRARPGSGSFMEHATRVSITNLEMRIRAELARLMPCEKKEGSR